ncbi:phage tail family protein [Actinacidiphila acidipaludis]|uniref:Phage tail family protein n=1 Tax=Actinacidiphila acidipaludis TaxID=2873382 RepID=A0ABS7Q5S1_9ACTN|nr:phage tail family protein [Streptomyces acidipaludis]MBY8878074.1 phage tail family protein [Streptomyces acidipaludis]
MAETQTTYTDDVPPGSLITQDGQIQWAGLLMGPGTSFGVDSSGLTGWEDLPEIQSGDADRPTDHGAWPGARYAKSRLVGGQVWLLPDPVGGEDAALDTVRTLRRALALRDEERWLAVRVHGETLAVRARVNQRVIPTDQAYATQGVAKAAVQWIATDPRRYQPTERVVGTPPPEPEVGLTWPLVWPLDWGQATSTGDVMAENDGSAPAHPVITFQGPCARPSVTQQGTGRKLSYDIQLADTDQLVVDTGEGTVTLNGTASRRYTATPDSGPEELFTFDSGVSELSFRADTSTPAARMTVTWRSAEW